MKKEEKTATQTPIQIELPASYKRLAGSIPVSIKRIGLYYLSQSKANGGAGFIADL